MCRKNIFLKGFGDLIKGLSEGKGGGGGGFFWVCVSPWSCQSSVLSNSVRRMNSLGYTSGADPRIVVVLQILIYCSPPSRFWASQLNSLIFLMMAYFLSLDSLKLWILNRTWGIWFSEFGREFRHLLHSLMCSSWSQANGRTVLHWIED